MIVEFSTSSGVDQLEIVFYGGNPSFKLEINGFAAIGDFSLIGPTVFGSGKKALLTFPAAATRRVRLYISGGLGFYGVRVPTGQSITKPTGAVKRIAIIGDSYVNGAGNVSGFPAGAGQFDTWAPKTMRALGGNDLILAGIGGTGFVAGGATSSYSTRLAAVLAMSPDVLIVTGSINDGSSVEQLATAARTFLDDSVSVPTRYVIGVAKDGYDANHDTLEAIALEKGVPFVPMKRFLHGTGNALAPGAGNYGVYLMGDDAHPTFAGHRALERVIYARILKASS